MTLLLENGTDRLLAENGNFLVEENYAGAVTTYHDLILSQSPALYWRLDETSGTNANDQTANNRDGTISGTYSLNRGGALTGTRNGAIDLTSGRVISGYSPFTNGTIRTYTAWVNPDTLTGVQDIFAGAGTSGLHVVGKTSNSTSLFIQLSSGASVTSNTGAVAAGIWRHIAVVVDDIADLIYFYVNGALHGTALSIAAANPYATSNMGNFQIGGRRGSGTPDSHWDGGIDEVAVFERGLTADEIADQYEMGTAANFPLATPQASGTYYNAVQALDPVLYWRLDETSTEESVTDISGNDNHGQYGSNSAVASGGVTLGETGLVDTNDAVAFSDISPGGPNVGESSHARAYTFEPYAPDGQISMGALFKVDAWNPGNFYTLFSSFGEVSASEATLEFDDTKFRWYTNVALDFPLLRWMDFDVSLSTGVWYHLVFTWDDATGVGKLYINGTEFPSNVPWSPPSGFVGNEGVFQVANRGSASYEILDGVLDEVVVYDSILTQSEAQALADIAGLVDETTPTVDITTGPSATKISTVTGKNESTLSITASEDFSAYQIRVVPNSSSAVTTGTLVESGGAGLAGVPKPLDVTGAELIAAVGAGTWIVKTFIRDWSGNWST